MLIQNSNIVIYNKINIDENQRQEDLRLENILDIAAAIFEGVILISIILQMQNLFKQISPLIAIVIGFLFVALWASNAFYKILFYLFLKFAPNPFITSAQYEVIKQMDLLWRAVETALIEDKITVNFDSEKKILTFDYEHEIGKFTLNVENCEVSESDNVEIELYEKDMFVRIPKQYGEVR